MYYAVMDGDLVKNVIVCDEDPEIQDILDITNEDPRPGKGWRLVNNEWVPPVINAPDIDARLNQIENLISGIDKPALLATNEGKALAAIFLYLRLLMGSQKGI